MQYEFWGSLFLFAFLGLLGHRSCRFLVYLLIALVTLKLNLIWLDAFVAGIGLCDLFVNRNLLFPRRYRLRWPILHFFRSSTLFTFVLWILIFIGVGCLHNGNWRVRHFGLAYLVLGVASVALTLVSQTTQRILTSRIPQFLGRISFGLYLIHIPVIFSFSCWFYLATFMSLGSSIAAFIASILAIILSVFLGYLLYVFADMPGIRLSRSFSLRVINASSFFHQRSKQD